MAHFLVPDTLDIKLNTGPERPRQPFDTSYHAWRIRFFYEIAPWMLLLLAHVTDRATDLGWSFTDMHDLLIF
jgi:hypothetical protein